MKAFGFGKAEKLKSRKTIALLFAEGESIVVFPLRVKFQFLPLLENAARVQAGVSVSKKMFKRAVDRNRIKRLLREAYRLQKRDLVAAATEKKTGVILFFIYTGKNLASFTDIHKAMSDCLQRLQKNVLAYENPD